MKTEDILVDLIRLPRMFNAGDVSMYELLRQTGYFELHDQISEAAIRQTLDWHPECVDDWISYSEDKRTSSGWFIKQENSAKYRVAYFSCEGDKGLQTSYVDRIEACAAFIKHELEDIRSG